MTFGLGQTTEDVDVTVVWPDGYQQDSTVVNTSLDQAILFTDDHLTDILGSAITSYYIVKAGGIVDWVFEWATQYTTDPTLDKVEVQNYVDPPPRNLNCSISPTVLTPATPGVEQILVPKQGGGVVHRLIWLDRTCYAPCTFKYKVTSAVSPENSQTSGFKQFSVYLCID